MIEKRISHNFGKFDISLLCFQKYLAETFNIILSRNRALTIKRNDNLLVYRHSMIHS